MRLKCWTTWVFLCATGVCLTQARANTIEDAPPDDAPQPLCATGFERPDEPGRYYTVSIYVKLNDPPDRANGSMRLYVNGKGVADHQGIRFRSVDGEETKISRLLFSTFHGGSSPKWAPRDAQGNYTTVHAYFDNFAVYEGLHVREKPGG